MRVDNRSYQRHGKKHHPIMVNVRLVPSPHRKVTRDDVRDAFAYLMKHDALPKGWTAHGIEWQSGRVFLDDKTPEKGSLADLGVIAAPIIAALDKGTVRYNVERRTKTVKGTTVRYRDAKGRFTKNMKKAVRRDVIEYDYEIEWWEGEVAVDYSTGG